MDILGTCFSFQYKKYPMKIQWFGCGHQSRQSTLHIDHFGLSNFHRLKFRNTPDQRVSKGHSKSMPTIAVVSAGCTDTPEPAFASRLIVREIINDFRHQGRAELLDPENISKWIRFKIEDLRHNMMNLVLENRQLTGFASSLSVVIFNGKKATIAQLGDTKIYHLRDGHARQLSDGDWGELLSDPERYPVINGSEGDEKLFLRQRLTSRRKKSIELKPLIFTIDIKKRDVICLCTKGVSSIVPVEKFPELAKKLRTPEDVEVSTMKILTRASELNTTECLSALTINVR